MSEADLDPVAAMAEHTPSERLYRGRQWCEKCGWEGAGEFTRWPCLPYRLAEALTASEAKVARVAALQRCSCMAERSRQRRRDPEPAAHRPYCREYVGPITHSWVRTSYNETFGGLDHWCSCGGWFRRGGLAGHGDGTENADLACPRVHLAEVFAESSAQNRTTGAAEAQQTPGGAEKSQELTATDDR